MGKMKKFLGIILSVFLFVTHILSGLTSAMALMDNDKSTTNANSIKVTNVTDTIGEEELQQYLIDELDQSKVDELDLPAEDEEVWVIIQMESQSILEKASNARGITNVSDFINSGAGESLNNELLSEQKSLKDAIEKKGITAEYKQSYTAVLNGFAAKIKYGDVEKIKSLPKVKDVVLSTIYYIDETDGQATGEKKYKTEENKDSQEESTEVPSEETVEKPSEDNEVEAPMTEEGEVKDKSEELNTENSNNEEVEREEVHVEEEEATAIDPQAEGLLTQYTGSGMVVAIVDTGLDYNHSAFQKAPVGVSMTRDTVGSVLARTYAAQSINISVDDVYYSAKLPYMFDYADMDADVIPTKVSVDSYGNDHGTHVAGISAGNDEEITGVAPDAQLMIMKVFSDKSSGAATIDILAALNDAVILGADVINMSLGSGGGFSSEGSDSLISQIYSAVNNSGINLAVSAGNAYSSTYGGPNGDLPDSSNPDTGIIGSPSSYSTSTSVASINGSKASYLVAGEQSILYAEVGGHRFAEELTSDSYEYAVVPGAGTLEDYAGIDVTGKVAVVKRGSISFNDKQLNAAAKGAVGCIIYNNRGGYLLNMSIDDYKIPTIAISYEDGAYLETLENKAISLNRDGSGDILMSDFSSWGPLPGLELKPEITAPGGNIYSSLPFQSYGYMSGTSMASPWYAGAAAVVKEYVKLNYTTLTEQQVEVLVTRLLMSTAVPASDRYGDLYSPRKQGAGVANVNNAVNTDAYLYVYGQDKPKLEVGDDKEESGVYTLSFHIKNTGLSSLSYDVTASAMTEAIAADGVTMAQKSYMFDNSAVEITSIKNATLNGNTVTVAGGKDATVTVKVTLTEDDKAYMRNNFENGIYVEGFVTLNSTEEMGVDLGLPYLAFFGDWTKAPLLDSTIYDEEEPMLASSYASAIMGGLFVLPLGEYMFTLPEGVEVPKSSEEKIAVGVGKGNGLGNLGYTYLGLLRGAKEVTTTLYDKATGKVVSEYTDLNVRKARYNSSTGKMALWNAGTIYPALNKSGSEASNTEYLCNVEASLDYGDPQNNEKSSWTYPVYIDYVSPEIVDTENMYTYTDENGDIYLDITFRDNRYLMAATLYSYYEGYDNNGNRVAQPGQKYYSNYTPFYDSEPNKKSTLTFKLTDIMDKFVDGKFYAVVSDYTLNESVYLFQFPVIEVTGVTLDKTEVTMKINDTVELTPTVLPENATNKSVTWKSSNEKVAVVKDGKVTSVARGEAVITATTVKGGLTAECKVTVTEEVGNPILAESVTLNYSTTSLSPGRTRTLTATIAPWNTSDKTITWTTSNKSVATVDAGVITAVAPGSAIITATAASGVNATCVVTVSEPLEEFQISGTVLVSYNGTKTNVEVPEGVTEIGANAFKDKLVETVKLPESVKIIGNNAFRGCKKLTSITMPKVLDSLGQYAFYQCEMLTSINVPTGVTELKDYTFSYCKALVDVTLPETLVTIGGSVFNMCSSLESIVLPNSVTKFTGTHNFSSCTSLKNVTLSENLEDLGTSTFIGTTSLQSIDFKNVKVIGNFCFQNSGFTDLVIPEKVESIGSRAFALCKELKSVEFEGSPEVGTSLFYDDDKLTSVTGGLTALTSQMFYSCDALVDFEIPDTVARIDSAVFEKCANLRKVIFSKDSQFKAVEGAFTSYLSDVFKSCTKFEGVEVEEGNKNLAVVDGSIYDAEKKVLLSSPMSNTASEFIMPDTVEIIASYAFYNKSALQNVKFSSNLQNIGKAAFYACGLTSVKLPDTVEYIGDSAFQNNSKIASINFGKSLKSIGQSAFYTSSANTLIEDIILPDTLEAIGARAFYNLKGAKTIKVGGNVEVIPEYAFYNCSSAETITLPDTVKEIQQNAFYGCSDATAITIPSKVETIGARAFYNCNKLKSIVLPGTVTSIGDYAFYNNYAVEELVISDGVTSLPSYAFGYLNNKYSSYGATKPMKVVKLPATLTDISVNAFFNCYYVEKFEVEEGNPKYASTDEGILMNLEEGSIWIWPNANTTDEFTIPDGMTSIGNNMFQNKTNIRKITVHEGVTRIGSYAFSNSSLEEIVFEGDMRDGLTIDNYAFSTCNNLKSINLPKGLTTIGNYAFYNCKNLESVTMEDTVTSIGEYIFSGNSSLKSLKLSSKIQEIKAGAFRDCISLETIDLPAGLRNIDFYRIALPFEGCTNLQAINVPTSNKYYKSIDGVLYDKNGLQVILYPMAKAGEYYEVPEGVTRIEKKAFAGNLNLKKVSLPSTLQRVGDKAFQGCYNLKVYNFNSTKAPVLEVESYLALFQKAWYGNFYDSYFKWDSKYNISYVDMDLELYHPENSEGYDSYIWDIFFKSKVEKNLETMLSVKNLNGSIDNDHVVTLNWDAAPWAEGYKVERAEVVKQQVETVNIDTGETQLETTNMYNDFTVLGTVEGTSFVDEGLNLGCNYMYKVTAYKDGGATEGPAGTIVLEVKPSSDAEETALKVINLIKALPAEVTLEAKAVITAARSAYEALTEDEKALVYNYEDLVSAEATLAVLEKEAADKAAADAVIAMIKALPKDVVLSDEEVIVKAREAYEALTGEQKALVTNYEDLVAAEAALASAKAAAEKEAADKATAKVVMDMIAAIPEEVTLETESVIVAARSAYHGLTEDQKALVTNYDVLEAAEVALAEAKAAAEKEAADKAAAKVVIDMIAALPEEVTLEDEAVIVAARVAYDDLTEEQKVLVTNYDVLESAEAALAEAKVAAEKDSADKAAAKAVIDMIAALPEEVALEDEAVIVAARAAYHVLIEDQKALVTNYDILVAAEKSLEEAKTVAEKEEADKIAAKKVEDLINAIDKKVTLESEEAIVAARTAYDALSSDQKALVKNYKDLQKAEKALEEAKKTAEKEAADKAQAEKVEELIKAIPSKITLKDEAAIEAARKAYHELTKDQKALVKNYKNLQNAEKALEQLKKNNGNKPSLPQTGAMVGSSLMVILGLSAAALGVVSIRRKNKR